MKTKDKVEESMEAMASRIDAKFPPPGPVNLLVNPGFEKGENAPEGWIKSPFPSDEVIYEWDNTTSATGKHSVSVEGKSAKEFGMWSQMVPVKGSIVYAYSGHVKFAGIPESRPDSKGSSSHCNLQVIFRDKENKEIKKLDLPSHTGTRDFGYDFPGELKVRAPENASSAEVNLVLAGEGKAWFDDIFFGPVPVGDISGTVTSKGSPLEGARVAIWGEPWGKPYETVTNEKGKYVIKDLPVAHPRYVVMASKEGCQTLPAGNVGAKAGSSLQIDFDLKPGKNPDDLQVRFGFMAECKRVKGHTIPPDARIPEDETGYPTSVRPFLKADVDIDSDHPAIRKVAAEILQSVPAEKRADTRYVAGAVLLWMSKNCEHQSVFPGVNPGAEETDVVIEEDFRDVTAGRWQALAGGWCWGHNFLDWMYKASEVLEERCVICAELARLTTGLLRALNIPARASGGSNEFWVQPASGGGFWVHMGPTGARMGYRDNGRLYVGLDGAPPPLTFSVVNRHMLHEDWGMEKKGLWRETHPFSELYEYSERGLNQAIKDLGEFKQSGKALHSTVRPPKGEDADATLLQTIANERLKFTASYQVHYSVITVSLLGIEQRTLDVRFPVASESDASSYTGRSAYWTNHPECVLKTWVETRTNPPVEGEEHWFHIEFDLTTLMERL